MSIEELEFDVAWPIVGRFVFLDGNRVLVVSEVYMHPLMEWIFKAGIGERAPGVMTLLQDWRDGRGAFGDDGKTMFLVTDDLLSLFERASSLNLDLSQVKGTDEGDAPPSLTVFDALANWLRRARGRRVSLEVD